MRIQGPSPQPVPRPDSPGLRASQARRAELLRLISEEAASLERAEAEPEKGRWIDVRC
ncbi:MAG: hypothetical protein IT207_09435 [Fimbriimonadaceae bacterium]|nr:hypothetical protein [Fimbriimonadaceae bacterium]